MAFQGFHPWLLTAAPPGLKSWRKSLDIPPCRAYYRLHSARPRGTAMPQSFAALYCHIIFSTKHREPLISRELQPRLFAYIGGGLRDEGNTLVAAGGMPDHVHP